MHCGAAPPHEALDTKGLHDYETTHRRPAGRADPVCPCGLLRRQQGRLRRPEGLFPDPPRCPHRRGKRIRYDLHQRRGRKVHRHRRLQRRVRGRPAGRRGAQSDDAPAESGR